MKHSIKMLFVFGLILLSLPFGVQISAQTTGTHNGHDYVDLGLSVKWATCNVGASSPEDYGGLYGWGDATGTKRSKKTDNYPSSNPPSNISGDSRYDIARAQWGGSWRLPTASEIRELLDSCTWTWGKYKGVAGYKVKGSNGNFIFLPATGLRFGTDVENRDCGFYWSGFMDQSDGVGSPDNLYFDRFERDWRSIASCYGNSIRPVITSDDENFIPLDRQRIIETPSPSGGIFDYYALPLGEQISPPKTGTHNGHDYVDLGLSVKWATCNVGAQSPEDYGGLYGWADATGNKRSTDFSDYPSSNPPRNICGDSRYDIARAQWGGSWRLPTQSEVKELLDRCTWTWVEFKGVNGHKVEGPNGNAIFLPAAGDRSGAVMSKRGSDGNYWLGELWLEFDYNTDYAYILYFSGGVHTYPIEFRYKGCSVRPVAE